MDILDALANVETYTGQKSWASRGEPTSVTFMRDLEEEDLGVLRTPVPLGSKPPSVQVLRERHHAIARLVADGRKDVEISAVLGAAQSRISILRGDPMFQELVAYYKEQRDAQYADVHARLAGLGLAVVEELEERIDTAPKSFTNRELKELLESTLDRSNAPSRATKSVGIQVNFVDSRQPSTSPGTVVDITPRRVEE